MKTRLRLASLCERRGSAIIFVAVALLMLLAFAALAIDVGYLYVLRGELQNAADSGALAGAQVLYDDPTRTDDIPGSRVYEGSTQVARDYVIQHLSEHAQVVIESIDRGHWSFATKSFTANNDVLDPPVLWNVTEEELDAMDGTGGKGIFINAVRVITRRAEDATLNQRPAFFTKVFGGGVSQVRAIAVAYIGFAGRLMPHEVDQPIAICQQAITVNNVYTCGVGRMLNSGQNEGHQTAGWTNFVQPCETASANDLNGIICGEEHGNNCTCGTGNPVPIDLNESLGTTNGTQTGSSYDSIRDNCWAGDPALDQWNYATKSLGHDGWPDQPWEITLPVIDCPGGAIGNCSDPVGAVTLQVVWITRNDKNQMNEVPRRMGDWPGTSLNHPDQTPLLITSGFCTDTGQRCWDSFVDFFHLQDILNGTPAFYEDKTLYFLPRCEPNIPTGVTGGKNFGILARIPVLVNQTIK